MALTDTMLDQLAVARAILEGGQDVVPAWHITTPEKTFLVLTRFDHDKPEQAERALSLVNRFMTWKMATSFVTTSEMWIGPEITRKSDEALVVVGVSRHERFALMQRILRKPGLSFGAVQWLMPEQVDEKFFKLLPAAASSLTHLEIMELEIIFGPDGEFEAKSL